MIILGLTGSIGMGKSTTAAMFARAGVPVHDADATVHALYRGPAVPLIEAAFPGTTSDGAVSREELGKRVFGKPDEIARLEAIVHPLVHEAEAAFLTQARDERRPVVVLDIPLLLETKAGARVDKVVVVTAPYEVQRARVLARGLSEERLALILARQMPDAEKRARADFVVDTSRGLAAAEAQVHDILASLGVTAGITGRTD
jgi:dephospho-CoA kinase